MNCKIVQEQLVDLLYEEAETENSLLKNHLKDCSDCLKSFENFKEVQFAFQNLQNLTVPPHLTKAIVQEIDQFQNRSKNFFSMWSSFILHPVSVALFVFSITISIVYFIKNHEKSNLQITSSFYDQRDFSSPYRIQMADWNINPRVDPDLDRPVLKSAELPSLEQASVESIAAFKHQIAIKYMIDGDDQKALQVLDPLVQNDLNYSHWDQAVFDHLQLMKKMGRSQEVKKDIARLKEYSSMNQEAIARAELVAR